ncbi:MAG: hypothetical protein ACHQZS_10980, partial [Candidatus Binatales bacterium]
EMAKAEASRAKPSGKLGPAYGVAIARVLDLGLKGMITHRQILRQQVTFLDSGRTFKRQN